MPFSSASLRFLVAGFVLFLSLHFSGFAQQPAKELTAEQKEKLKESHRYSLESSALEKEGKLHEAIAAAQKMLAIELSIFGEVHRDVVGSLKRLARMHESLEDFAAADKERQQVLVLQTKLHGGKAWQVTDARWALQLTQTLKRLDGKARQELKDADQWMSKATANNKPGQFQQGAEFAVKALEIRLRLLDKDSPLAAFSASYAGNLWERAGELDKAQTRHEQALAIYRQGCGEIHPSTMTALKNLGRVLLQQKEYPRASELFAQALTSRKKDFGDDDPAVKDLLNFLEGHLHSLKYQAKYAEQEDDFATALKQRQGIVLLQSAGHGQKHWQVTDARLDVQYVETLAKLDQPDRQSLKQAEALIALVEKTQASSTGQSFMIAGKALAIRTHLTGEGAQLASSSAMGAKQSREMRGHLEKALALQKKVLGANHVRTAATLNHLGLLLYQQGDYTAARPCFEQALATRQAILGNEHPGTAACLNNLGALLDCQGDYAAARPFYEQALLLQTKLLGEDHPAIFLTLNNLGSLHANQKKYAEARQYFDKALTAAKKNPAHPETLALTLNNLGTLLATQADYPGAQKHFEQALKINEMAYGEIDPDTAFALNNLGVLQYLQGNYKSAQHYFERTLDIRKKLVGAQHPDTAASLNNLGSVLYRQGKVEESRSHLEQALAISRHSLDLSAAAQSERQQLLMVMRLRHQFDNFLNLPCETEAHTASAYGQVLAWKGSVLVRQQQFHMDRLEPKLAPLVAKLRETVKELAHLAFVTPTPGNHAAWSHRLAKLTEQKEALERDLSLASPRFHLHQQMHRLTPAELLSRLPADLVLCDFVVYRRGLADAKKKDVWTSENHLAVFVLKKGHAIVRIDLGPLEPIEKAIELWRARTKDRALADADHPGMELRRRLWLPLEKQLAGTKRVLISPDGALGRLPFAALPGSKEGSYLLEEVALSVIPVPRLLPELLDKDRKEDPGAKPSLLLVGDVDFDAAVGKSNPESRVAATGERDGKHKLWKRLPATLGEILVIERHFKKRFKGAAVESLSEDQATEANLRDLASRYSYLHLATHGFFAPPSMKSAMAGAARESSSDELFGQQGVSGFHPGLLSGLVLAGANKRPEPGQSDGILTALEVAELDLSKVELAVLSACETGLGKEAAGEGLLGLQRAFQVAGAKSVVGSLWKVDDEATRKLMERFYENLWQKKMTRQEALRQAQLAMLHGELGRGFVPEEPKQNPRLPPHYWAAFVISGDWR